jgi:hypothetical protein
MATNRSAAWQTVPRTLAALALLQAALPLNLAVTAGAAVVGLVERAPRTPAARGRTVLISGGKMTKALQLARCFHRSGHRVVLVESARYRWSGHRFSTAVSAFHVVPEPADPAYVDALVEIVRSEGVDVFVPVCSPVSSRYDALAKAALTPYCEVVHPDPEVVDRIDDKHEFAVLAASLGLAVPETHRVTDPEQVVDVLPDDGRTFVLKSIAYDPVHRLDLTPLPLPTPEETRAFARSKPISASNPWIVQEYVRGTEYCTHGTARNGALTMFCCSPSSPFQVNYTSLDKPDVERWVTTFVAALGASGQFSFDVIETPDGRVVGLECNPRTHSAVTLFDTHPDATAAYLGDGSGVVRPLPTARPTYWLYHEVWRAVRDPRTLPRSARTVIRGRDALLDPADPLPFLLVHHLQIPSLLIRNLVQRKPWIRIDFNIGKLVEPAGD